jgi:NAD+ synthetase
MLRITSAQINPTIGDMSGNIALMVSAARKAREEQPHVIVFPELSLTAYYPCDLLDDESFLQRVWDGLATLKIATREMPNLYWVIGTPTEQKGVGKRLRNSLLVIKNGEVLLTYDKQLLPTYGVFDESRHFSPGPDVSRIINIAGTRVGFMICEDGWNDEGKDYPVNPFARLSDAAPDLVVSINASPSHIGKREGRHDIFSTACARHKLPLLYVNQVGGHDQLGYDGASFAVDSKGNIVFEARRFEQDITTLAFDPAQQTFFDKEGEAFPKVSKHGIDTMPFYKAQIELILKDYARRCGFNAVVVGCSGGIDSALTLALAASALGAKNVTAITMPSQYSSKGSVTDSELLCKNLGIKLLMHPIGDLVHAYSRQYKQSTKTELKGVSLENLQARIRGTILMEYSNMNGALLLTTGNKSEVSVGYCTLYGDTNGGLGLIGDLYKTEVFSLSRHINDAAGREIIPRGIIEKAPSAELAPNQKDTDSLPPYEVLDSILKLLIEGGRLSHDERDEADAAIDKLIESDNLGLVARIKKMIARNEYKRRQSPPVARVRARAFGSGRQIPIASIQY